MCIGKAKNKFPRPSNRLCPNSKETNRYLRVVIGLDQFCVRKTLLEEFNINSTTLNNYFSDHDEMRIQFSKKDILDFSIC